MVTAIIIIVVHVGGRPCPIRRVGRPATAADGELTPAIRLPPPALNHRIHRDVDTSERFDHIVRTQSVSSVFLSSVRDQNGV